MQTEVIATILRLIDIATATTAFIQVELYLSKRLSTFRIEGTSDALILTREDPTDIAARYHRSDPNFGAFLNEFTWIKQEATPVVTKGTLPSFIEMFPDVPASLIDEAREAASKGSPYVR